MQAMRSYANEAAMLCAGAFALLIATAASNYLRLVIEKGGAQWGEFLGQFMLPAIPLGLALALLAMRSQAAATLVAGLGTVFYLFVWVTLAS